MTPGQHPRPSNPVRPLWWTSTGGYLYRARERPDLILLGWVPVVAIPVDPDSLAALRGVIAQKILYQLPFNAASQSQILAAADAVLAEILGDVEKETGDA